MFTSQIQPSSGQRGGNTNKKNSMGCAGCSVCWGMVRVCRRDSRPLVTDKDSIILEGGPENRWSPLSLPQLERSSPCFEGIREEQHLQKDLHGL